MTDKSDQPANQVEGDRPEPPATSRREFLSRTSSLVVGAGVLGVVAGGVRLADPDFQEGTPARFVLGLPADFKTGTLTWLRERDLFVLRDERGFGAFSSRCTHLGCTVRRTAGGFFCPCHGARFDPQGRVEAGPARRPLPWYRLWLEPDGRIWVDTTRQVPAVTVSLSWTPDATP